METHQLMGLTLVPVSLLGIICNWSVVFAVCKRNTLSHSFSLLTANQAVFNGIQCNLYFLYVAPMIIFDINSLKQYSHVCGLILVICYDVSIQADFLITINRFLAVFLPVQYTTMFSKKRTKHMIAVSFFLSLFIVIVFFHARASIAHMKRLNILRNLKSLRQRILPNPAEPNSTTAMALFILPLVPATKKYVELKKT
ncbi:hypothetical protein GCK72_018024 [Caenorhabditis remanei]|uniref:G-protein coupled receptors family 1 profile domain-containing protein n=1 Tax=Caenorhabditis remanei TaxID=31234 RepID=A0A6A5G910_CAERE|nr:hypothetical protein GCK72_018024 [Caenorhabditis remanei]KAF1751470.1 hypothetical protein GCK72_018024 [Caenorhabditis remanei]